jgi:hypothetical protein
MITERNYAVKEGSNGWEIWGEGEDKTSAEKQAFVGLKEAYGGLWMGQAMNLIYATETKMMSHFGFSASYLANWNNPEYVISADWDKPF